MLLPIKIHELFRCKTSNGNAWSSRWGENVVKHLDRAESNRAENFPYDTIEEVVVNTVYHRCYDVR